MSKPFSIQSPRQIAKEYGGNIEKIRQAWAMGLVDPTAALLAGMFIDRMRDAQSLEQGAQPTVAQQVLAPPAPASAPAAPPASGAAKFFGAPPPMAPQAPPMGMASGGLTTLPIPDNMFDEPQYGGGGIVAFAGGDKVEDDGGPVGRMRSLFGVSNDPAVRAAQERAEKQYAILRTMDRGQLARLLSQGGGGYDPAVIKMAYEDALEAPPPAKTYPPAPEAFANPPESVTSSAVQPPPSPSLQEWLTTPMYPFGKPERAPSPLASGRPEFPPVGLPGQSELPLVQPDKSLNQIDRSDVLAAYGRNLPAGLAASAEYNQPVTDVLAYPTKAIARGAAGVAENYRTGAGTMWDAMGEAGGWLLGTDYKSRDQREAEAEAPRASRGATGTWDDPDAAVQSAPAIGPTSVAGADMRTQILGDNGVANVAVPGGGLAALAQSRGTPPGVQPSGRATPPAAPPTEVSPETLKPAAGTELASEEDYLKKINDYRGDAPGPMAAPDLAAQKKEDMWATVAQMGFGAAAGTSPYALANFGKGAADAMPGMQKAMDRRREAKREAEKAEYEYKLKLWGVKGDDFKSARDMHMKDVDARLEREKLDQQKVEATQTDKYRMASLDVQRAGVAAQGSTESERMYARISAMPEGPEKAKAIADWESVKGAGGFNPYDVSGGQAKARIDSAKETIAKLQGILLIPGMKLTAEQLAQYEAAQRVIGMAQAAAPAAGGPAPIRVPWTTD